VASPNSTVPVPVTSLWRYIQSESTAAKAPLICWSSAVVHDSALESLALSTISLRSTQDEL
jgi:hypothetical protein